MTSDERRIMLDQFGAAHGQVLAALKEFPGEALHYKPAPDRWSIHEILVHLGDSEANAFIRFRRCIAEPGTMLAVYDQDRWTPSLNYAAQSADDALELFKWLRHATWNLLRTLPEAAWQLTAQHPERGTITLEKILVIYTNHITGHIQQMKNNFIAWNASQQQ